MQITLTKSELELIVVNHIKTRYPNFKVTDNVTINMNINSITVSFNLDPNNNNQIKQEEPKEKVEATTEQVETTAEQTAVKKRKGRKAKAEEPTTPISKENSTIQSSSLPQEAEVIYETLTTLLEQQNDIGVTSLLDSLENHKDLIIAKLSNLPSYKYYLQRRANEEKILEESEDDLEGLDKEYMAMATLSETMPEKDSHENSFMNFGNNTPFTNTLNATIIKDISTNKAEPLFTSNDESKDTDNKPTSGTTPLNFG